MQAELAISIGIHAPADEVWSLVTDWKRQAEWMPQTHVRASGAAPPGIGQSVTARTALGPVGFDDTMVVTAWDPPRRCEVLHTGALVKGVGAFLVEPAPPDGGMQSSSCVFTWWERVQVPGGPFAPVLWRVAGPVTRLMFGWAVRRLRAAAEAAGSR